MSEIDPKDYEGYGCTVCPTEDWFHVNVHRGRIDILRNLVIHESTDTYIQTQVKNVSFAQLSLRFLFSDS